MKKTLEKIETHKKQCRNGHAFGKQQKNIRNTLQNVRNTVKKH